MKAETGERRFATATRGFGPPGILAILFVLAGTAVTPLVGAVLALAWARWSRTPWRELGFARPRSWWRDMGLGVALGIAFKLLMKAVVMPLLGAPPVNQAYHDLVGNPAALPGMLFAVVVGAGFGEETLFRGYMFERLGKLLGSGARAKTTIVLMTSALFAVVHYREQGLAGVQQAAATGLVFGTVFAVTGELWMLMWVHAAFDLTAVAIIYLDLETRVAHMFFRS